MKIPVSEKKIFEKIAVRKPYYSLKELTINKHQIIEAKIPIEQPLGMEIPPISAAEASRHLAIFSCSTGLLV